MPIVQDTYFYRFRMFYIASTLLDFQWADYNSGHIEWLAKHQVFESMRLGMAMQKNIIWTNLGSTLRLVIFDAECLGTPHKSRSPKCLEIVMINLMNFEGKVRFASTCQIFTVCL